MNILYYIKSLGKYKFFYHLRHPVRFYKIFKIYFHKNSTFNDASVIHACSLFPELLLENTIKHLMPKTILDVGCGTGKSLDYFLSKDIICYGIEGSDMAISKANNPHVIIKHNLNKNLKLNRKFDLVWCFEVAEHIHPKYVDNFLSLLTNHSDTVLMSAAHPGQGGTGHFNEQSRAYWISIFEKSGYFHDNKTCKEITNMWEWYPENIFLFRKLVN